MLFNSKIQFFLLAFTITNISCRKPMDITYYYVKFAPIGISDIPLDTLCFSTNKSNYINQKNNPVSLKFNHHLLTNQKTLAEIISFVDENDHYKSFKDYNEYGSFNITIYNKNSVLKGYNLRKYDALKYFNSLIKLLTSEKLDPKVSNEIKYYSILPIE